MNRAGIVGTLARICVRVVLVVSVLVALAAIALPTWYRMQGDRLLVVTSGSMEPTLEAGDAIVLEDVEPEALRPLMVVTYRPLRDEQLVTHRVHSLHTMIENGEPVPYMRTRGDANETYDPDLVPVGNVVGVVAGEPAVCDSSPVNCGKFLLWAQTPWGRLAIFGPPLLALVLAEIGVLRRLRRDRRTPTGRSGGTRPPRKVPTDAAPVPV